MICPVRWSCRVFLYIDGAFPEVLIMFWNAKNAEVDLGDTKMSYVSFGSGEKTLILIPGLSDGLTTVRGKALVLAGPYKLFFDKYTVYMFSRKDRMPEGYSIRNMAEDQATAMEILGIRKACVMGVSEGGMIAQYLAIDHPEMVEKLVLSVTAPGANDVIKESVGRYLECAKRGDHKSLMIATAEDSYSPSRLKSYRKIYPILGMIGKPSDYGRFFINCNAILKFDATDELDKIKCPTLIIGGDEDKTVGVQGSYDLHQKIPESELFIYPGLGHAAYEEAKDFNKRVYDFIERA